jgi:hypothetical protein
MVLQVIRATAAAALITAAGTAHADDASCRGFPAISPNPSLTVGHIASREPRIHFVKDGLTQPGCPNRTPACGERAYLVPGDRVIVSTRLDAFVCVTYINAKGSEWSGWLPADAVAYDNERPIASADWLGRWSRDEADISVKAGKAGALLIKGDATYGARDPDRVKRGGVNTGTIEGEVTPARDSLSFAMGGDATLPVDKGGEFDCQVWMRRLGPWLIVDDNTNCGGLNVTFRGVYRRKP